MKKVEDKRITEKTLAFTIPILQKKFLIMLVSYLETILIKNIIL